MIPSERLARRGMKVYPTVEKSGKWDRFLNHFHTVTFYGLPAKQGPGPAKQTVKKPPEGLFHLQQLHS